MSQALLLKPNETVLAVVRRFILTYFCWCILIVVCILAPFFFLFPLFSLGFVGIFIFVLLLGAGVIIVWRTYYLWSQNKLILTNLRVIDMDQRGFFDRTVSEVSYDQVEDVSYRIKGVLATMFHYGTLRIQSGAGMVVIELRRVHNPEKFQQIAIKARRRYLEDKSHTGTASTKSDEESTL